MVGKLDAPDDDGRPSSTPPSTEQGCPQSQVPRALTTDRREDSPNIAEERATPTDVASFPRRTGRVILQALEARPKGADVSDKGLANRRQACSLPQLSAFGEDHGNASPILCGDGDTTFENRVEEPRPAHAISGKTETNANAANATDKQHNGGLQTDNAQDETPPHARGTPAVSGHTANVENLSSLPRRSSFGMRALPIFLRTGDSKASFWKGSRSRVSDNGDRETTSGWNSSTCRSVLSGEDIPWSDRVVPSNFFPEGHDHARARKNWRVIRLVLLALGMFRVAGLNRLRAKQLSAAEVKRGLRRNVIGGGHNFIPTMSYYSPKVASNVEAATARYEALCEQWARFSPAIVHRMLHRKLLEKGTIEQEYTCKSFSATLLFADISGFTRLSARLNAEQLKTHTNHYFTLLIDVVARYGGDIIKFCGDAVMILWPAEPAAPRGVLQANAMQASECALAMLCECGTYDVGKGEDAVSLRLHCGMGSGNMYAFLVGTEGRWEFLVAGDPLRQIGIAEPEAKQGEVILSPESWDLSSAGFVATKTPQGNWLLKEPKDAQGSYARTSSPASRSKSPKFDAGSGAGGSPMRRQRFSAGDAPLSPTSAGRFPGRYRLVGSPAYLEKPRRSSIGASTSSAASTSTPHGERNVKLQTGGSAREDTVTGSRSKESHQKRRKGRKGTGAWRAGSPRTMPEEGQDADSCQSSFFGNQHQALTVTRNVNTCSVVLEQHRLQASEFLASYIKAQFDGGVEKMMTKLSTALRGYTQESARHAIESNTVKYLAEIRFVTTIFINIYGLEEQLKSGGGFLLQQTMDVGVISLSKFGGVLRQFVVDDKGCVMIGAFGLPQYSYEDNEVRAVSASKEIMRAFKGLNLAASIGITTGQVYCGFVGSSKRCEYAMMGCSVNLSARLMASAPMNTIQVDFEVWSRARNFFDFETLSPINAKGYVDPVPVFRPLGQALTEDGRKVGGSDGDDISVGVDAELEMFSAAFRRMKAAGYARPVLLVGQAGSGKTHLLRSAQLQKIWQREGGARATTTERGVGEVKGDVTAAVAREGCGEASAIITAVCRNVHANTSYYVWRSILKKIFGLHGEGRSRASSASSSNPPAREPSPSPVAFGAKTGARSHDAQGPLPDSPESSAAGGTACAALGVQRQPSVGVPLAAASASGSLASSTEGAARSAQSSPDGASVAPRDGSPGDTGTDVPDDVGVPGDGINLGNTGGRRSRITLPPIDKPPVLPCIGGGGADYGKTTLPRSTSPESSTTDLGEDPPIDLTAKRGTEALVRGLRVNPTFLRMNTADRALLSERSSPRAPLSTQPSERSLAGGTEGIGRAPPGGKRADRYLKMQNRAAAENAAVGEGSKQRFGEKFGLASVAMAAKISSGIRGEPDWTTVGGNVLSRKSTRRSILTVKVLTKVALEPRAASSKQSQRPSSLSTRNIFLQMRVSKVHKQHMEGVNAPRPGVHRVSAVGQAVKVVQWIEDVCPAMLPLAPLLGDMMFTGFRESRTTSAFPSDVRHRNLERLVMEIVRGAIIKQGTGYLLLIVEDAQWMNSNSMKILLKLATARLKVFIVISARPFEEYFETIPNEFTAFREMSTTIEMSPLSPADCLKLARCVVGEAAFASRPEVDMLPPGSDVVLHEKSGGGNPLFVRNIAAALRDNLVMTGQVTPLADLPTEFFHSLIVSRFDALEPQEKTVLKAATVIGATFEKHLLLHMLQDNSRDRKEHLHAALLKLVEANFISRSVVGQTERFSFVHTAVQETVYKMMLTDQKENLHKICAEWHETHFRESTHNQSVIMHHWIRSGNTPKKIQCHTLAAAKAHETFASEEVIQHMLALIAIAFGRDMATATVISLEPFIKGTPDSEPSQSNGLAISVGAGASAGASTPATGSGASPEEHPGGGTGQEREAPAAVQAQARSQPQTPLLEPGEQDKPEQASIVIGKKSVSLSNSGVEGKAANDNGAYACGKSSWICNWLSLGNIAARGGRKERCRHSSLVFPVAPELTAEEAEAEERQNTVRTAARLGIAVGNLNKRQRAMLVAKDQEWLWASDFLPCLEFSDPIFTPSMVARWIGEIGLAHLRRGRLLPAHNHMQEALAYLGFSPVPKQTLLLERATCLALEYARQQPRDVDDALFAARLYGSIADISIKAGMDCNLAFINRLVHASTRGVDFIDCTPEGIRLMVNFSKQELERGRHEKAEAILERALTLSANIDDPVTTGIVLIASGTYNAGQGMVNQAEEDLARAFELFAPAGDTSRCGEVMVEAAYVHLCSGNTGEALFMFQEVRDVAFAHKDDFLSQASLHGAALVHAITGKSSEALQVLAQLRMLVEEDWARRRGRRGKKAAATEGTSHASLIVMEALEAYLAAGRGDGKMALQCACRASRRFCRCAALRFSSGLHLHLVTEACFTTLEQDILPPDPEARPRALAAARRFVRTLGKFSQVFDLMSPLHQLGRARWSLLHGMETVAEDALDMGLIISEKFVHFPLAEGLLLLHSSRLECLPMEERRARARRGRRTLHYVGACMIPTKEGPGESSAAGAGGAAG